MPGNKSTVWSAKDWTLSLNTQTIDHGRGDEDGDFMEISQDGEDFGYKGSASGFGTFFEKGKNYCVIKVTLPTASDGNDVLQSIHEASKALGGAPGPILAKNNRGTSKLVSDSAMILKTPDETVSVEPGTKVWEIGVHDPVRWAGGQ